MCTTPQGKETQKLALRLLKAMCFTNKPSLWPILPFNPTAFRSPMWVPKQQKAPGRVSVRGEAWQEFPADTQCAALFRISWVNCSQRQMWLWTLNPSAAAYQNEGFLWDSFMILQSLLLFLMILFKIKITVVSQNLELILVKDLPVWLSSWADLSRLDHPSLS